jgi:uncharacterized protein with HEPN domain
MHIKGRKYLSDILVSIDRIEIVIVDLDFETYKQDFRTHLLIERLLSIIGEAAVQYEKLDSIEMLENNHKIKGLRNILIHNYDSIDPDLIWQLIKSDLPKLKNQVERLLAT